MSEYNCLLNKISWTIGVGYKLSSTSSAIQKHFRVPTIQNYFESRFESPLESFLNR